MKDMDVTIYLCEDHIAGDISAVRIPRVELCSVQKCYNHAAFIASVTVK